MPIEYRFSYVKEHFDGDKLVKVIKVNDTELGIPREWSVGNWEIWLKDIKRQIIELGYQDYELIWYVAEENYREELEKYYNEKVVYVDRKQNVISSSLIRNNPIKYWSKIARPFQKLFSHNILIIGTSSEGKTNLVRDIGEYFNSPYSHEVGRDVVKFKEDKNLVAKDFVYNIYEQNKLNGQMIASMNNNGVFISDTDNLVTLMYAKDYALKEDFSLTIDDYETILLPLAKMYARSIKWNKIYLLKPHEKFIDDGIRCLANSSYESRLKLYNILVDLLKDFNYEYEVLERTYEENFLKVKEYINKYMEGKYEN